jgi:hypothetical protein
MCNHVTDAVIGLTSSHLLSLAPPPHDFYSAQPLNNLLNNPTMNLRSASRSILQAKAIQTTAVAPSILRRDGAIATPNRVQWLNVVTVQLIDLEVGMREVNDNVFVPTGHEVQCFHCKCRKMKCRCDCQSIPN